MDVGGGSDLTQREIDSRHTWSQKMDCEVTRGGRTVTNDDQLSANLEISDRRESVHRPTRLPRSELPNGSEPLTRSIDKRRLVFR